MMDMLTEDQIKNNLQNNDYESNETKTDALTTWRRFLVGPLLGVYMFGYMMSYYTVLEYTNTTWLNKKMTEANATRVSKSCHVNKGNGSYTVPTSLNMIQLYYSLARGIPAVVANLILGSYTDALGRKFLFGVGILGTCVRLIMSIVIIYFQLDLLYFIGACFIEGCTGQYGTSIQACSAYMGDITKASKERTYGLAYIYIMVAMSLTGSSIVTGYLIDAFGYVLPMVVAAGILILNLVIMIVFLPESHPPERRIKNQPICSMLYNCISFFIEKDIRNNRWKYQLLLLAHGICDCSYLGRLGVETLYQMTKPICWSAREVGIFGSTRLLEVLVVAIGPMSLCKRLLPDLGIAMLGVASYAVGFMFEAFAWNDTFLYIAAAVSSFGPLESIMVKSIASVLTDGRRQGAIFSAIAAVETISSLLSNVGTSGIYSLSVGFMRGFVFIVMSGFNIIALIFLMILYIGWKLEEKEFLIETI